MNTTVARSSQRTIRIFLSSTFRDFGEERDLLVKRVFPALRARLKDRFVELVDVDLRWGITAEEAERGEVLPICLAEIDRARPYFIGMLGERYGWIPPADGYAAELLQRQPWLKKHQGGKSVTELEILHGVLNNRRMKGRAFFYFRSPSYARTKGGDYLPSPEERAYQTELKRRIRERGLPVTNYANPEALAKRIERDLWKLLDAEFPASSVPDAFERERIRHEAYAAPRRRLYLGGERYQAALAQLIDAEEPRIVVEGASGGGKSALLANFFEAYRKRHPRHLVHEHYLGASSDAANPHALVRRLIEFIQRATGSTDEIPGDPQKLMDSLPICLATASAWARKRRTRFIFVLDSLNSLTDQHDLRWWPAFLPKGVTMLVSCLPGAVHDALKGKIEALPDQSNVPKWKTVTVRPLTKVQSATLLNTYLERFNKKLPQQMVKQVQAHPLATNPLFIRTLAEELRLFGVHEQLQTRLDHYLTSQTIDDLFERVLARVEKDCGKKQVKAAMTAIWASRAGLTEKEILGVANLTPATWAAMRHTLGETFLEADGKITFAHDYLRKGVRNQYLQTEREQWFAHRKLGSWFRERPADARRAQEEPYQWRQGRRWRDLKVCLIDRPMFEALREHTSEEELWSYWVTLEGNTRARAECSYKQAWPVWKTRRHDKATGELTQALARFLYYAGRYGRFVEYLFRKSLAIIEKTEGTDHPEAALCLNNLALLLQASGDYTGAEPLFRRALSITEIALGLESPEAGLRLNSLASLLKDKGDYAGAEPLFRRALTIAENTKNTDGEDGLGFALNNLANFLSAKKDYSAALPLYQKALAIAERLKGSSHPLTGSRIDNVAQAMYESGNYAEAEKLYRRALEIREAALGLDHVETGITVNNLAMLYFSKGDYRAAEVLARRDLAILEKSLGPNHYDTGISVGNIARIIEKNGDLEGAEQLMRRALEIHENALGATHPITFISLHNLTGLLISRGSLKEAKKFMRRAMLTFRSNEDTYSGALTAGLQKLGAALRDAGHLHEAEEYLLEALRIAERDYAEQPLKITPHLTEIGQLRFLQEQYHEAHSHLNRCLEIIRANPPIDNIQLASIEARLAEVQKMLGVNQRVV
jgi:tetratricopeptide (TPR) repeat protein